VPFTANRKVNVSAVFDLPDDKLPSLEVTTDQMGLRIGYMKGLVSLENMQVNIGRGLISAEVSRNTTWHMRVEILTRFPHLVRSGGHYDFANKNLLIMGHL
jgi:hypothetical protein